jgi:hypothetical protein
LFGKLRDKRIERKSSPTGIHSIRMQHGNLGYANMDS